MTPSALLDTGPLVAYLDRRDPAHDETAAYLNDFSGQLHTTAAVITEAMYFVAPLKTGPAALAELIAVSGTRVWDFAQPAQLRAAVALMARYDNTPMDYADATLLLLAEAVGVFDILTLDRRGFATFRTAENRALRLLLDAG